MSDVVFNNVTYTAEDLPMFGASGGGNPYARSVLMDIKAEILAPSDNITITSGKSIWLGSGKAAITLTDAATDIVAFSDCNVGIGITPSQLLHIYKANDNAYMEIQTGATGNNGTAGLYLLGGNSNASWVIGTNRSDLGGAADNLFFYKNSGTTGAKLVIQDNGNVGIGTANAGARLTLYTDTGDHMRVIGRGASDYSDTVYYATNNTTRLGYIDWSNTQARWNVEANIPLRFYTNSLERLTILGDGNVGIGTTTPIEKLQVAGGIRVTGPISAHGASHITMDYSSGGRLLSYGSDASTAGTFAFISRSSDASINNTVMTILDSGHVGIGTAVLTDSAILALNGGLTQSVGNGGTWDFATALLDSSAYLVTINCITAGQDLGIIAYVFTDGNVRVHTLFASAGIALSTPAANTLRLTNSAGSTLSFNASFIRLR